MTTPVKAVIVVEREETRKQERGEQHSGDTRVDGVADEGVLGTLLSHDASKRRSGMHSDTEKGKGFNKK